MNISEKIAVIDFETTGSAPNHGARATEVAAVIISRGEVIGTYESLMNAGVHIPSNITRLTGITNEMVASAPSVKQVMRELHDFVQDSILVAHNASFDRRFLVHEGQHAGLSFTNRVLCTLLLSRRAYPEATNHKLGTLATHVGLKTKGSFHRALYDAEITAQLLLKLIENIKDRGNTDRVPFDILNRLQRVKIKGANQFIRNYASAL